MATLLSSPARRRRVAVVVAAPLAVLAALAASGCTEPGPPKAGPSAEQPVTLAGSPPEAPPPAAQAPQDEPPLETRPETFEPPSEAPPATSPPFSGRLIVRLGDEVHELAAGPNGAVGARLLATLCERCGGEQEAAVSPNGRFLAYSVEEYIEGFPEHRTMLLDLRSGEENPFLLQQRYPAKCLAWSPDGSRLSWTEGHLFVGGLSVGQVRSRLVYETPNALYTGNVRIFAGVGCAVWLGPERLLFQRFEGEMPQSIVPGRGPEPNGTSLATLRPRLELASTSRLLEVSSACATGQYVLFEDDALLAPGLRGLSAMRPRRVYGGEEVLASGFLPGTCTPYAVTANGLHVIDPEGPAVEASYEASFGEEVGREWQGIWISEPSRMDVAVVGWDGFFKNCPCSVSILNLKTGRERELHSFPEFANELAELPEVLAWLPE